MARRATIRDVAQEAGVSVATVNRVLAGAGNVREETGRAVAEAAHRVGYHATSLIEKRLLPTLPAVRLGILLHKRAQEFYQNVEAEIRAASRECRVAACHCDLEFSHTQAPSDVADSMRRMAGRVDVIAATAVNHPAIDAAVDDLRADGVRVFSLLSDFAQGARLGYFGLNNLKVGRGAARMVKVAAPKPGKIAIFVGGHRWHGHELRETGFRSVFREFPGGYEVLDPLINLETRQLTHEAMLDLLERHPELTGVYVAGGGMEGAISALREVRKPGEVALVVNEFTRDSQFAMVDGYVSLVIATPLRELAARLVDQMARTAMGETVASGQTFLEPVLYLPEFF